MNVFRNVLGMIALLLTMHPLIAPPAWSWAQTPPATGPAGKAATSASSPASSPTTTSAPSRPIKLAVAGKNINIQIVQGDKTISELPAKGRIILEAKSFSLKLKGNVDDFSFMALSDPKLFAAVRDGKMPLCTFVGTGGTWVPGDLILHSEKLDLYPGDKKGLAEAAGPAGDGNDEFVRNMLKAINDHFKVKPMVLTSAHFYVYEELREGKEAKLKFKTINDKPPAAGQKIWLVLLLENPLDDMLKELDWLEVPLEFAAETKP